MNLWQATVGGECQNPMLYADYSDPDVIRVGDDSSVIASSFTYVPGGGLAPPPAHDGAVRPPGALRL